MRSPRVEIVRTESGLHALADEWNAIAGQFATPLLRHEWFAACAAAFCPPGRLTVVVIRFDGEIAAIAPLVAVRQGGVERLELLGTSFLFEPSGFLYTDRDALRELLHALMAMKRPLLLRRLPAESPEVEVLREVCREFSVFAIPTPSGSPWLPITGSWDAYEASLSSSIRSNFRRARRRAEAFGMIHFELSAPAPNRVDPYLETIFRVEAAGWKGRRGTAMLSNTRLNRFYSLYAQAAADLGMLRIGLLRVNGSAAAAQLAVEYAGRYWVLKIGYDETWARCSPGTLLMHETIWYAFQRRLEAYEFLGSDEPWLHVWTDRVHPYVTYRIYPYSWAGLFWTIADGVQRVRHTLFGKTRRHG
jgi:CelD/BcsL family acetyltransferase involved in cellulose biosynthesis